MEAEKLDQNLNRLNQTSSSVTKTNNTIITDINITEQISDDLKKFEKSIELNAIVVKANNLITGSNIYSMISSPRGFCLIINNVDFDNTRYPKRIGSDQESERLSIIFSQLHFEVIVMRNQNGDEMLQTLHRIAKHNDLKKHDSLVVIILSHGNSGQIIAADNTGIEFEKVLKMFNNQNCPQMIKKPKMFFFNCCRGSTLDFGPQFPVIEKEDDRDVADAALWPHVPIISDMMICYSTIDGYVSWRNEHNGTWFGSALAQALSENAFNCELNQILTIASDVVHRRHTKHGAKQAIEWKYRAWTKSLFFNPGIYKQ